MKKTRNLIVLMGDENLVKPLLEQLRFKGASTHVEQSITERVISEAFNNNKSIICGKNIPERYKKDAIYISVADYSKKKVLVGSQVINVKTDNLVEQFEKIVNKLHLDIGDHVKNDSGINGAPDISSCGYCKYIKGIERIKNQRTVYSSKHFYVVPTLGEFANGYLLIIPYRHIMSYAELNTEEREDFLNVLSDVKEILRMTYGTSKFLVWENGTGNGGKGKAKDSVVHAHMHIAPTIITDLDIIEDTLGTKLNTIRYEDLPKYSNHSYLLVESNDGLWKINDNPNLYIPRQYVRQILAVEYGFFDDKSWNWRVSPFYNKIKETVDQIYNALNEEINQEKITMRIKQNTRVLTSK